LYCSMTSVALMHTAYIRLGLSGNRLHRDVERH
jgi:hypothetical protein